MATAAGGGSRSKGAKRSDKRPARVKYNNENKMALNKAARVVKNIRKAAKDKQSETAFKVMDQYKPSKRFKESKGEVVVVYIRRGLEKVGIVASKPAGWANRLAEIAAAKVEHDKAVKQAQWAARQAKQAKGGSKGGSKEVS